MSFKEEKWPTTALFYSQQWGWLGPRLRLGLNCTHIEWSISCPPHTSFLELGKAIDGHQQLRSSIFSRLDLVPRFLLRCIPVNAVVYCEKTNINEEKRYPTPAGISTLAVVSDRQEHLSQRSPWPSLKVVSDSETGCSQVQRGTRDEHVSRRSFAPYIVHFLIYTCCLEDARAAARHLFFGSLSRHPILRF